MAMVTLNERNLLGEASSPIVLVLAESDSATSGLNPSGVVWAREKKTLSVIAYRKSVLTDSTRQSVISSGMETLGVSASYLTASHCSVWKN